LLVEMYLYSPSEDTILLPKWYFKKGCGIKCLYSVQQEMLAITRRQLCPQTKQFIIC